MLHAFYVDLLKDRVMAWTILILLAALYVLICLLLPIWSELVPGITSLLILLATEILVYLLHRDLAQEQPAADSEEYTSMIANIDDVGQKLSDLAAFLKRERGKVEEAEATVMRLRSEQSELEPMVTAQRELVDAILAVHTKRIASRAWKEYVLTFITGVVTSLLAGALFESFWR
ncbi:MAG TPA: hypothetical protein VFZ22_02225 [Pyrinomonadaceae bacterium]|nr:hypothetical protein [Pyrinomonadaceae bacterium]